jgi:hypothetical protein
MSCCWQHYASRSMCDNQSKPFSIHFSGSINLIVGGSADGCNWVGPRTHLGPWVFWAPRNLVHRKFGPQEIWSPGNLVPKKNGPPKNLPNIKEIKLEWSFLNICTAGWIIQVIESKHRANWNMFLRLDATSLQKRWLAFDFKLKKN